MALAKSQDNEVVDLNVAKIYTQQDLHSAERYSVSDGEAVAFTRSSPEKITGNEDTAALVPLGGTSSVLIVADGVGGLPSGGQASTLAVQTIVNRITHLTDDQTLRDAILDGIEAANQTVMNLGTGAATTLAVIEIHANTMRAYHAGDSLILLTGQRGKLKFQNVRHSPTGYAVESGFMDESDAIHHEERSLVFNVVGDTNMRIEICAPITIAPRDTLLVASDGLADNLYVEEIVDSIRTGPLQKAAEKLIGKSHERMRRDSGDGPSHPDDLTFILFRQTSNTVSKKPRQPSMPLK